MKLRKLFVILLALLVVFSFVACDGSGGGSDDNGSTNSDNGENGGDNGGNGGENEDPSAVTWPVRFQADNEEFAGAYFFIDFYENGTFTVGEGGPIEGEIQEITEGGGTYTGDDPHGDGTISMSGTFGETPINGSFTITDGVLPFEMDLVRQ